MVADIIEINNELIENAQFEASKYSDANSRKQASIDLLGINCAIKYLQINNIEASTRRSLFKIPLLTEEFKINDIYYNNWRIDVITLYKENAIKIPRIHLDCDILPDFYLIVQIGSKMIEAKIIGFLDAKKVINSPCNINYCFPSVDSLFNIKDFKEKTKRQAPVKNPSDKHDECIGLFLKLIDKNVSLIYKSQFINHLMACDECMAKFIDIIEFEKLASNIKKYPDLLEKYKQTQNTSIASETFNFKPDTSMPDFPVFHSEDKNENKDKNNNINDNVIKDIFGQKDDFGFAASKKYRDSNKKHYIIIGFVVIISFALLALIALSNLSGMKADRDDDMEGIDNLPNIEDLYPDENTYETPHQARLIPKETGINDILQMQTSTIKPSYSPTVKKVAWEVPKNLAKKPDYAKFLQLTGKNVKLNLQNELLLVHEVPINKYATTTIKISPYGEVTSVKLVKSSGSQEVDMAVVKVIRDSLQYMKPPSTGLLTGTVEISLTIELN